MQGSLELVRVVNFGTASSEKEVWRSRLEAIAADSFPRNRKKRENAEFAFTSRRLAKKKKMLWKITPANIHRISHFMMKRIVPLNLRKALHKT